MSLSKLLITIVLIFFVASGAAIGAVLFLGVDVPVVADMLGAQDDGAQDVGFDEPTDVAESKNSTGVEGAQETSANNDVVEKDAEVTDEPKTTEKIVGYSEFIGDGYAISLPTNWETEVSIDKRSLVATSEVENVSISVQVGVTGKTLDEFAKSATELLWSGGNLALCINTSVGEFPAKEIEFISGDRLISGRELTVVDDALGLAYIVIVQCPVEDEGRYESVMNDVLSSFKLIEVTTEAPKVRPKIDSLGVTQLFEEDSEGNSGGTVAVGDGASDERAPEGAAEGSQAESETEEVKDTE